MMLGQSLNIHSIFKRQAKALIRLLVCASWSDPLLVTQTTLLEISCHGSVYLFGVNYTVSSQSNTIIIYISRSQIHLKYLNQIVADLIINPFILDTCEQVLWQTLSIMLHFVRVSTVCKVKIKSSRCRDASSFRNFYL